MDFGIALPTAADSWKVTQRAEELGFSHAWFYDTQMLSADCFVAMGAAAVHTKKIRLGTGVLVPSNRIAPVAANALATLNQLAHNEPAQIVLRKFERALLKETGALPEIKPLSAYYTNDYLQ